jgi:hypothetical protein
MFGRQAFGESAHAYRRADQDPAPHIYLYALFDADADADAYFHVHVGPADGYAHSGAY